MSIVKLKNRRSGVTYVYESESYWDKEKKQPRSKRTLIGKLDEETGEIIPTGKSGRRKASSENQPTDDAAKKPITDQVKLLAEKDEQIRILKAQNKALKKEKQEILDTLKSLCSKMAD